MDPKKVKQQLEDFLKSRCPWGLEVSFKKGETGGGAWATEASGPAFKAAEVALEKGYGKPPFKIGCGGSIPFVKPFAEALGGAPALLIGVEDPYTDAHGENESLLVSDLEKAMLGQIYLFEEVVTQKVKI
jgi:acetylornithine deacetylase/succinyl-diaminopimelate desuccinylase-like protein